MTGTAQTNLTRSGKPPVSVTLNLHLYPADARMTGAVSSAAAGWNSAILADRAVFSASANPAVNYAGQFTLLLPPGTIAPDGYGYAAITNTLDGISTGVGALADGAPISWAMPIAQDGSIPLYQSLYSTKGSLLGWIIFTNDPPQNVSGQVNWIKPFVTNTLYPSGFTNLSLTGVLGSPFTNTPGAPVLDLTDATLVLSGGNLAGGVLTFTNLNLTRNTLTNLAGGTSFGITNYLLLAIKRTTASSPSPSRPPGRKPTPRLWGRPAKPDQRPGRLPRHQPNRLVHPALSPVPPICEPENILD